MVRRSGIISVVLFLVACGGAPAATPTAQSVIDAFKAAGVNVTNIKPNDLDAQAPVPRSFKDQAGFELPDIAPAGTGGQVFVCDTKKNCDAIYAYYDALKALAGPYLYQSPDGRVIAQLNSGLKPDDAAKLEAVITGMK
jgi:hypothetical protein